MNEEVITFHNWYKSKGLATVGSFRKGHRYNSGNYSKWADAKDFSFEEFERLKVEVWSKDCFYYHQYNVPSKILNSHSWENQTELSEYNI